MTGVNWQMGIMPDIGGNALAAFERGQERGRQRKAQEAFAAYATNPGDKNALNALAPYDPKFVISQRKDMAETQAKAQEKQRADLLTMSKLLSHAKDPATYAQARQAAQMYGMDISQVPEQYDPNWVGQTKMLVDAFNKDGGQTLTTLAQNVMMTLPPEQRDPNSPVFVEAFNKAFIAEQTKTIPFTQGGGVAGYNAYTGQTNTIIAPNPGGMPTGAPVQSGGTGGGGQNGRFTFDMYRGAASTQGKAWADNWIMKNGFRVSVRTPQEARQLPKGTPIILPDGTEGVVP